MKARAITTALVAAFFACMCAGPGVAIIPSTLEWAGWAMCPAGSSAKAVTHSPRAGTRTVSGACVDADGEQVPTSELKGVAGLFAMYFLPLFIVIFLISLVRGSTPKAPMQAPRLPQPLHPQQDLELRALLRQGQKIQAVKRVRELSGVGLKEALDYVNWIEYLTTPAGASAPLAAEQPSQSSLWGQQPATSSAWGSDPSSADESTLEKLRELKDMLDQGLITEADYDAKKRDLLARM